MSVDPHGYPWPDTPPMTTPPDDPRADEALVEALQALRDRVWFIIGVNDPAIVKADAALTAARSHGGM